MTMMEAKKAWSDSVSNLNSAFPWVLTQGELALEGQSIKAFHDYVEENSTPEEMVVLEDNHVFTKLAELVVKLGEEKKYEPVPKLLGVWERAYSLARSSVGDSLAPQLTAYIMAYAQGADYSSTFATPLYFFGSAADVSKVAAELSERHVAFAEGHGGIRVDAATLRDLVFKEEDSLPTALRLLLHYTT